MPPGCRLFLLARESYGTCGTCGFFVLYADAADRREHVEAAQWNTRELAGMEAVRSAMLCPHMRLVSYNILDGGVGRADPIAEILQAQNADIVVLLEADDLSVVERIAGELAAD